VPLPRTPQEKLAVTFAFALGGALLAVAFLMPQAPADRFPGIRYPAKPFVLPAGCVSDEPNKRDRIPYQCLDKDITISNYRDIGLKHSTRGDAWIRYYNDALHLQCSPWTNCYVLDIVKDKFFTNQETKPLTATRP
jgi:hypothetical protein